ncbi:MAG: 1-deoxy-D-xylulose-5-phosphate synthase [Chlamydiota bacterium]|nr:1-deoxy-D-xylulose-5-phosphate synthase [Chlamydiota bacterium]
MDYQYLNEIESPDDVKKLSIEQLEVLAREIRSRIINVLSETGGHLASNLGVVELTLAMHKVFNSPNDKFIWDVSHQTYVHKLLTGRNDRFHTIRQYKGLSGFSSPTESEYDHFHAGHAGTALSLAMGVAKNRDLQGDDDYVIPVIGDATLTCGLPLEALNNISRDLKRFIVILNDNEMSISKNVGAITKILSRMINNPTISRMHQEVDSLVGKLPGYGSVISKQGHKIAESLKNLVSPAAFFEHYELTYIGPIDGHSIKDVVDALEGVKNSQWPVILHVLTKKGQGMDEAIKNPVTWHGAKPFCQNTCKFFPAPSNKPTFPKIFGKHLLQMAKKDESLVCITPAMSAGSSLDQFIEEHPDRCLDVGIAEGHSVTYAAGIAYGNQMRVFSSVYATFFQRAFDNLFHDVCLQEIPVVFALDRAGIAGGDGQTHNGIYDISFMNAMPNMVISQPRNGHVLKELMESAHSWNKPAAIRYPNLPTEETTDPIEYRELGKSEVISEGKEVLIIALGHMVYTALELRDKLTEKGIIATVLDPIFVKPLDTDMLDKLLLTHNKIVTIEEHSVVSGMGAIINNFLISKGYSDVQVVNCGIPEIFLEQGKHSELLDEIGLTAEKICERVDRELFISAKLATTNAP